MSNLPMLKGWQHWFWLEDMWCNRTTPLLCQTYIFLSCPCTWRVINACLFDTYSFLMGWNVPSWIQSLWFWLRDTLSLLVFVSGVIDLISNCPVAAMPCYGILIHPLFQAWGFIRARCSEAAKHWVQSYLLLVVKRCLHKYLQCEWRTQPAKIYP